MARPFDPPSLNKHSYVRNDPVNYVDPDGNSPFAVTCWVEPGYVDRVRDRNVGATLKCVMGSLAPPGQPVPARLDREPKESPIPTLGGADESKDKDFKKAIRQALKKLKETDCAALFNGNGVAKLGTAKYEYDAVSAGAFAPTNQIAAATDTQARLSRSIRKAIFSSRSNITIMGRLPTGERGQGCQEPTGRRSYFCMS